MSNMEYVMRGGVGVFWQMGVGMLKVEVGEVFFISLLERLA